MHGAVAAVLSELDDVFTLKEEQKKKKNKKTVLGSVRVVFNTDGAEQASYAAVTNLIGPPVECDRQKVRPSLCIQYNE